ncbi:MAG: hypothetical protein R3A79_16330 [Nannocystaceae bacterium]
MNRIKSLGALLALSLSLGIVPACAFGTRTTELEYPPRSEDAARQASASEDAEAKRMIAIALLSDERDDKRAVGHVRNTFGIKTARVESPTNLPEWVKRAFHIELKKAGYKVIKDNSSKRLRITGSILEVYCDAYFRYGAKVSLMIQVRDNEKDLFTRKYVGEGSAGWSSGEADGYAESLALALADAVRKFIADLDFKFA